MEGKVLLQVHSRVFITQSQRQKWLNVLGRNVLEVFIEEVTLEKLEKKLMAIRERTG